MNVFLLKVYRFAVQGKPCAHFEGIVEVRHLARYKRPETFDATVSLSRDGETCMYRLQQLHLHQCLPLFDTEAARDEYIDRVVRDVKTVCAANEWEVA